MRARSDFQICHAFLGMLTYWFFRILFGACIDRQSSLVAFRAKLSIGSARGRSGWWQWMVIEQCWGALHSYSNKPRGAKASTAFIRPRRKPPRESPTLCFGSG